MELVYVYEQDELKQLIVNGSYDKMHRFPANILLCGINYEQ